MSNEKIGINAPMKIHISITAFELNFFESIPQNKFEIMVPAIIAKR